ncbi:PLC-like phosphodiesterase [Neocallimastix californiae]|uniref:PLC-like phosphodiesterase n=1 Tax=Neocallimastix californiae TaxID=1754190 RepID=A0A1Y1ZQE9_9FUNG|nr:PLC-like phosphodiesterase [Neocallimastix californiae]|eukprot:ORY12472.1 PLC-like phosphodiesterase [Neocallimastix californiae]
MKSLFITVIILLINYSFCSNDKGKYLELNKTEEGAYLVAKSCTEVYICSKHNGCFYRDEKLDNEINIDDGDFNNPDKCSIKRYATISTESCYMSSTGEIKTKGTHDTGIYDIGKVWKSSTENNKIIDGSFFASVKSLTAQTQDLNIKDQLKNGIRYLDIRLHLDAKDEPPYLYHGYFACYDSNTEDYLYLKNVLKYCIYFLVDHKDETIILHLKREGIKDEITNNDIAKLIESIAKEKYNKEKDI